MCKERILQFIILFSILISCKEENEKSIDNNVSKCPCDSIGFFQAKNKKITLCQLGKSQIEISGYPNNDTLEVTRRYTTDDTWHFQEYMVVVKDKMIDLDYALYCDIKDTSNFFKLTYIRNERVFESQGVTLNKVLGVDLIINNDSLHSNNIYILVPKNRFKGIIKFDKIIDVNFKGNRTITRAGIYIDAEEMIKHGSLLEQYRLINKYCF